MAKAGTRRPLLRIAGAAVVAVVLAWLVISASAPRALSLRWATGFSRTLVAERLFRESSRALLKNRGRVDDATYTGVAQALRVYPLAADPFMFHGIRALEAGELARAERLLTEARQRNPRSRLARLALIGLYLQTRRVPQASTEIAVFVRLVPEAGPVLAPELGRYALNPQTRSAVVESIGADPLMEEVLYYLATNGADADLVQQLAARLSPRPDRQFAPWQSVLIAKLIERGNLTDALAAWRRFAGVDELGPGSLIVDPQFERRRGPPPFDWDLSDGNVGVAERAAGPALEVEFFGRRSGVLARQLVMLRPGRYWFGVRAEGSANGQGSRIAWQVVCREGGAPLLNLPIVDLTVAPRDLRGEFTVPASPCGSQWLQLVGIAAEFPATQSASFSDLQVQAPAGGR